MVNIVKKIKVYTNDDIEKSINQTKEWCNLGFKRSRIKIGELINNDGIKFDLFITSEEYKGD